MSEQTFDLKTLCNDFNLKNKVTEKLTVLLISTFLQRNVFLHRLPYNMLLQIGRRYCVKGLGYGRLYSSYLVVEVSGTPKPAEERPPRHGNSEAPLEPPGPDCRAASGDGFRLPQRT